MGLHAQVVKLVEVYCDVIRRTSWEFNNMTETWVRLLGGRPAQNLENCIATQ